MFRRWASTHHLRTLPRGILRPPQETQHSAGLLGIAFGAHWVGGPGLLAAFFRGVAASPWPAAQDSAKGGAVETGCSALYGVIY